MSTARPFLLCFLLAGLPACFTDTTGPGPTILRAPDAGTRDGGGDCENFSGYFRALPDAVCAPLGGPTVPTPMCIQQTGCDVSVTTPSDVLKGTVKNDTLTVSGSQFDCTAIHGDTGLSFNCSTRVGAPIYRCTIPMEAPALPSEAASVCCDPVAQSCGDGQKCTYIQKGTNQPYVSACLPKQGGGFIGDTCAFTGIGTDVGRDDCQPGLFCTRAGREQSADRWCRKLCNSTANCPIDQVCWSLSSISVPRGGVCAPTCTFFGSDCPAFATCRAVDTIQPDGATVSGPGCTTKGSGQNGDMCRSDSECGASLYCNGAVCLPYCDPTHPCRDPTQQCVEGVVAGTKLGYCLPKTH